jgi:hypothetical protein
LKKAIQEENNLKGQDNKEKQALEEDMNVLY